MLAWTVYPIVMGSGILLFFFMGGREIDVMVAAYVSIIMGALFVTYFEWRIPYRSEWWPKQAEVAQDAVFMACIQGMLPKLLSLGLGIFFLSKAQGVVEGASEWWPGDWPVPLQMLLMMMVADGFRYWLHRWAHEWELLWRFHAVHHAPHKLYWLNVGRFHPVDKSLQFLFDTLPFIILGVSQEVLALYAVCYAMNGFFQHSNVDLRLGFFNYVISGPELHRWHHSKWKKESNHNYGNNLILWDVIFGTWYLPVGKVVGELGLVNRSYPDTFLEQMASPFTPGLDKQGVSE